MLHIFNCKGVIVIWDCLETRDAEVKNIDTEKRGICTKHQHSSDTGKKLLKSKSSTGRQCICIPYLSEVRLSYRSPIVDVAYCW